MATENGPCEDVSPIENGGSITMSVHQRVKNQEHLTYRPEDGIDEASVEDTGAIHVGSATKRNNLEVPGKHSAPFF